jgi:membrane fusion protein, multidrug efflux system
MDELNSLDSSKQSNNHTKKVIAGIVFSIVTVIGLIAVYCYIQYKNVHITTDDAFIDGHVHTIASKISGTVKSVTVIDNQPIKKGDLLVEIDVIDYDVKVKEVTAAVNVEKSKVAEAQTRIDAAKKQLAELRYRLKATKANLDVQIANRNQAELDIKRAHNLFKKETISKERYEKTKTGYDVNVAQVRAAEDQVKQIEASLETQNAIIRQTESALQSAVSSVKQKEATLQAAELNRDYTKVYAPSDGYITKKSVEVGNQIQPGQPLMAVVPLHDEIWVTANYKETQLEKVRPRQKVEIKVDTFPGKKFIGTVDSIMAGTGAAFSLFPPENATGNYVKVVQRIPVKILFDKDTDPEHVLRMGMSVEPTIVIER